MIHESNNRKDPWEPDRYDSITIEFQCRNPQNDTVSSNNNDNNDVAMYLYTCGLHVIIINVANYKDIMLGLSNMYTGSFKKIIFILLITVSR